MIKVMWATGSNSSQTKPPRLAEIRLTASRRKSAFQTANVIVAGERTVTDILLLAVFRFGEDDMITIVLAVKKRGFAP